MLGPTDNRMTAALRTRSAGRIVLPSSMEPASGNTTVTASSVTDSSSWRVAACSAVWSAMSSVLTSSSLAAS